jgi:CubicO group peptidase (beta-lactamase class C family)
VRGTLALLLLLAPVAAQDLRARVDTLARQYLDAKAFVGIAIGVVPGPGKEPLVLGYGRVRPGEDAKPRGDTVYEIGSISKVFTGTLLAMAVEKGEVRLDQPVAELLPENGRPSVPFTLGQLATHTSGLSRMPSNFAPKNTNNPFADYTYGQLYAFLREFKPAREAGATYEYSNVGVGLLGHALERKTGKTYEALLVDRICAPLGMDDTRIALTDAMRKRLAPPHGPTRLPGYSWDIVTLAGAGGIRSTVDDMLKFLRANLDARNKAMAEARRTHFKGMGLGWHLRVDDYAWHNGQTGGYHSFMAVNAEKGVGVVVLANTANGSPDQMGDTIMGMLTGKFDKRHVEADEATLQSYVGQYALTPTFTLTVTRQGQQLMVQATGQQNFPVFPESKTKFFYKVVDAQLVFEVKDGKAVAVTLFQGGQGLRAPRKG